MNWLVSDTRDIDVIKNINRTLSGKLIPVVGSWFDYLAEDRQFFCFANKPNAGLSLNDEPAKKIDCSKRIKDGRLSSGFKISSSIGVESLECLKSLPQSLIGLIIQLVHQVVIFVCFAKLRGTWKEWQELVSLLLWKVRVSVNSFGSGARHLFAG